MIFGAIAWGGVAESYLYPIYGGIVLLAGLITICTVIILDQLKELNKTLNQNEKEDEIAKGIK